MPGTPLLLDRQGLGERAPGDLAVVRKGRGRARLERVLGPASSIRGRARGPARRGRRAARLRALRPSADRPPRAASTCATGSRSRSTPRPRRTSTTRSRSTDDRAFVHIADVSWFVPAGTPLDRGAAERAFSVYVPGLVSPMLPPELSEELCSLRPNSRPALRDRRVAARGRAPGRRAALLPLGDPQPRAPDLRRAQAILPGASRPSRSSPRRSGEPSAWRTSCVPGASPAARCGSRAARSTFAFDGQGGVERAWRESEPHAHMLVEELMILANELVAGLLAGRRREALYRVHELPEPQSVQLLLARLADLGVPTPPAPERMGPRDAAAVAGAASEAVTEYVETSRPRPRRVPATRPAGAEAGPLRPGEPRPHGARQHGVLPFHLADPPLPRPGRPPRAAARARRLGRTAARGSAPRSRSTRRSASGTPRSSSTGPTRSASPGCSSSGCSSSAGARPSRARSPA